MEFALKNYQRHPMFKDRQDECGQMAMLPKKHYIDSMQPHQNISDIPQELKKGPKINLEEQKTQNI